MNLVPSIQHSYKYILIIISMQERHRTVPLAGFRELVVGDVFDLALQARRSIEGICEKGYIIDSVNGQSVVTPLDLIDVLGTIVDTNASSLAAAEAPPLAIVFWVSVCMFFVFFVVLVFFCNFFEAWSKKASNPLPLPVMRVVFSRGSKKKRYIHNNAHYSPTPESICFFPSSW